MTKEEILSHIRAERARRNLTIPEAAKLIGIKSHTYRRMEVGLNVGVCAIYKTLEFYKSKDLT